MKVVKGQHRINKSVMQNLEAASNKYKTEREKSKRKYTAYSLEKIWIDTMREFHPKARVLAWSKKDIGQTKHLIKLIGHDFDYAEFFQVIIQNWETILSVNFKWMQNVRNTPPSIGFILKYTDTFLRVFEEVNVEGIVSRAFQDADSGLRDTPKEEDDPQTIERLQKRTAEQDNEIKDLRSKLRKAEAALRRVSGKPRKKKRTTDLPEWDE